MMVRNTLRCYDPRGGINHGMDINRTLDANGLEDEDVASRGVYRTTSNDQ